MSAENSFTVTPENRAGLIERAESELQTEEARVREAKVAERVREMEGGTSE